MLEVTAMEGIDPVFRSLHEAGLAAVVTIEDEEQAVPLARALLAGGVRGMELTLRTQAALPGLQAIAEEVPEMILGAGTVLAAEQVSSVQSAGAQFAVAPGTNPEVLRAAAEAGPGRADAWAGRIHRGTGDPEGCGHPGRARGSR